MEHITRVQKFRKSSILSYFVLKWTAQKKKSNNAASDHGYQPTQDPRELFLCFMVTPTDGSNVECDVTNHVVRSGWSACIRSDVVTVIRVPVYITGASSSGFQVRNTLDER